MAEVSFGFVSRRERSGAARTLLKAQRDAVVESRCWMQCGNREMAAQIAARLILKGRTFDVVINRD